MSTSYKRETASFQKKAIGSMALDRLSGDRPRYKNGHDRIELRVGFDGQEVDFYQ